MKKEDKNSILGHIEILPRKHQLVEFDMTFKAIVSEVNERQQEELWVDSNGNINFTAIKREAGVMGSGGFNFYSVKKGKCIRIPSKENILLIAAVLELSVEETEELLRIGGFSLYPKNLREFIVYIGLNNACSLEEIQTKLEQYGYRERSSLSRVEYIESDKIDIKRLSKFFKAKCKEKHLLPKKVFLNAGLVHSNQDMDKNNYYYNAFMGMKETVTYLMPIQCISLFNALKLNKEEQSQYAKILLNSGIFRQPSKEYSELVQLIKEENEMSSSNHCYPDDINNLSVFTTVVKGKAEKLKWWEIDDYIKMHFNEIRSFATYYQQLLEYNSYKSVSAFTRKYSLSERSHYDYVAGFSIPTITHLTSIALLMPKLSEYIYKTMLKKGGQNVFVENEENIVLNITYVLINIKEENEILFGKAFTILEDTLYVDTECIGSFSEEIFEWYLDMCKILTRKLLAYIKDYNIDSEKKTMIILDKLQKGRQKIMDKPLAILIQRLSEQWENGFINNLIDILLENYGFDENSNLIQSLLLNNKEGDYDRF